MCPYTAEKGIAILKDVKEGEVNSVSQEKNQVWDATRDIRSQSMMDGIVTIVMFRFVTGHVCL